MVDWAPIRPDLEALSLTATVASQECDKMDLFSAEQPLYEM